MTCVQGRLVVLVRASAFAAGVLAAFAASVHAEEAPSAGILVPIQSETPEGVPEAGWQPSFALTFGTDVYNQYYFRGIIQEDEGAQFQPYVDVAVGLYESDDVSFSVNVGIWNSVHTESTGSGDNVDHWYELDFYAGASLGVGDFSLDVYYTAYTSPSDSFSTVDEISVGVSYDDSDGPLPFALNPYIMFAFEFDDATAFGADEGIYLEVGVEPGLTIPDGPLEGLSISFPLTVGLSIEDYYNDGVDDDAFGYFQGGVSLGYDIPVGDSTMTLSAGFYGLALGDSLQRANSGDSGEFLVFGGVSFSF